MATIGANNSFVKLMAKPGDIRVTWPQQTLVNPNAEVTVVGYRNAWDKPHLKKVRSTILICDIISQIVLMITSGARYTWNFPCLVQWGVGRHSRRLH